MKPARLKIAVTGTSGQIVTALLERGASAGYDVIALGRPELDLVDSDATMHALLTCAPDVIVSAAAYTAVDKAESEAELAFAINGAGPGVIAKAAKVMGIPLIHISTDYVFDGMLKRPYNESDPTGPTGVYGASKLAGEHAVLTVYPEGSAILRVAWVYSPFGGNFVKTMLRLASSSDEISVVADQIGNPTSALDIADGILTVATNLSNSDDVALRGLFHMTAHGEASWADFAEAIFIASDKHGGPSAAMKPITTIDYPTPAKRPATFDPRGH